MLTLHHANLIDIHKIVLKCCKKTWNIAEKSWNIAKNLEILQKTWNIAKKISTGTDSPYQKGPGWSLAAEDYAIGWRNQYELSHIDGHNFPYVHSLGHCPQ